MAKRNFSSEGGSSDGTNLQDLFMEAVQLHQNKNLHKAEEIYQRILKAMPGNSRVLSNLGILYNELHRYVDAEKCYAEALQSDPFDPSLHLNLGALYEAQGDLAKAISCFRKTLELQPANPKALNNLGKVLCLQGLHNEAEKYITQALRLEPRYPLALNNLGVVYSKQGKNRDAIKCLEGSLALQPSDVSILYNLAGAYGNEEKNSLAVDCLRRLLQLDPNHAAARHMLAAYSGQTTETAPHSYITETFDLDAAGFDSHLEKKLHYTVPAALRLLLQQSNAGNRRFARTLDLGCGTGLSGRAFRDLTEVLIGVDLSSKMLEQAELKQLYDKLIRQDVTLFLSESTQVYDLFIATDVFIYIGKLDPLFSSVCRRAAPDAYFVFSIEKLEAKSQNYQLRSSGRYAHSLEYIERLAEQYGFRIVLCRDHDIRKEKGHWIPGNLLILSKK